MFKRSARHQYIAVEIVSIGTFICGITVGWASTSISILESDNSHLATKLTNDQVSWITSIQCIGALVGTFLFGWSADIIGRKYALCASAIPGLISFVFLYFSTEVYQLYIARFLGGLIGGGAYVVVPIYISEIAETKLRGTLSSQITLLYNFGVLFAFIVGNYCSYFTALMIYAAFPLVWFIGVVYMPETPFFLMKHNQPQKAEQVYRYFRSIPENEIIFSEKYSTELKDLHNLILDKSTTDDKLSFSDFTNYTALKAQIIGMIVASLNQLSGVCAMIYYASTIFKESGSNLSPNMSSIIVGIVQLIGTYTATILVERTGRKILMVTSCLLCSIILFVFGGFNYLKLIDYDVEGFKWVPLTCFVLYIFIVSFGPLTLPFIIISEIMPEKIRGCAVTYCIAQTYILGFICVKYFYLVTEMYGIHISLCFFGMCCIIGSMLLLWLLPETTGKSFNEIQKLLTKERK